MGPWCYSLWWNSRVVRKKDSLSGVVWRKSAPSCQLRERGVQKILWRLSAAREMLDEESAGGCSKAGCGAAVRHMCLALVVGHRQLVTRGSLQVSLLTQR